EDKRRLALGEPLAYVIVWQPFLGLKIFLDSHPLVPRPETEWWVEQCAACSVQRAENTGRDPLQFLDLCAGSGAIGCAALARLPSAHVSFGELDPAHEATIRKNIRENGLDESRADVRIGDLFAPFGDRRFDVIAANPPYIPEERVLDKSVTDFEPRAALFAGSDGLALIRRIAAELPRRLNPGGIAYIECDSAHAEEARALFERAGLSATVIPDQYGTPRVVVVR
ncbi:MAG: hypothetical protein B7W98_03625, partial [Parcubacteria group bacterium 20-58-5]